MSFVSILCSKCHALLKVNINPHRPPSMASWFLASKYTCRRQNLNFRRQIDVQIVYFSRFSKKTRLKLKFSIFASESSRRCRDSESKNCVISFRHVSMWYLNWLRIAKNYYKNIFLTKWFFHIEKMAFHQELAPGRDMQRKFWIIAATAQFV